MLQKLPDFWSFPPTSTNYSNHDDNSHSLPVARCPLLTRGKTNVYPSCSQRGEGGVSVAVLLMETSAGEVLLKSWVPLFCWHHLQNLQKLVLFKSKYHIVGNCGKATYSFFWTGLGSPWGWKTFILTGWRAKQTSPPSPISSNNGWLTKSTLVSLSSKHCLANKTLIITITWNQLATAFSDERL